MSEPYYIYATEYDESGNIIGTGLVSQHNSLEQAEADFQQKSDDPRYTDLELVDARSLGI